MLGTGHAVVTKCYNTCFTIEENGAHFLVDAGGGNGILKILQEEKISLFGATTLIPEKVTFNNCLFSLNLKVKGDSNNSRAS